MKKIIQATERGQVTLPKKWRDKYKTKYFVAEIKNESLILKPLKETKTLAATLEDSWQEYIDGEARGENEVMKKYRL